MLELCILNAVKKNKNIYAFKMLRLINPALLIYHNQLNTNQSM